ncbi:Acetolactate synthase large subunit [Balamuthia mandrillaris]
MEEGKNRKVKATDLFVECLEAEGVEYIFGVPGEENLDFLDSLRKSQKIKLVLTRHEQAAAFMATTIGRLTGKAGVCLSTLGPGATNFTTGAAYAQLGGMPMMMITGQKPIRKSKQGRFQIIATVDIMAPVTKFTKSVASGYLIPPLIREAFRRAEEERPGAVHLEIAEDIAEEMVSQPLQPFSRDRVRRPIAEEKAIRHAIQMIQDAKRPLLLIGAAANRKMTSKMVSEFVEKTGLFVFNTQMGKGVMDETHQCSLGTAALSQNDYVHAAIAKADLIVNIGHDVIEKPPFFMTQGENPQVIHVNFISAEVDSVYFPQLEVIGDIANAIWQIKEGIDVSQSNWDFSFYKQIKTKFSEEVHSFAEISSFPMDPRRVVADVRKAMPSDGIVCLDNGMYKIWFARNYPALVPNTLLLDNALATMGAGLPSAIAARLVHPERKVLAVCGDGGFMMNSQEMETAVRLNLDLVVMILNDNAYGMIQWKQAAAGFESWGLSYTNPDFVKYAEAYGAHGHRVNKPDELLSVLTECLNSKGVHLIDVPINYAEGNAFLNDLKKHYSA